MSILHDQIGTIALRFPPLTSRTAARITLAWLERKIAGEAAAIDEDWNDVRTRMQALNTRKSIVRINSIDNDFWICKRANPSVKPENALLPILPEYEPWSVQQWQPPESWEDWPLFDAGGNWLSDQTVVPTRTPEPFVDVGPTDASAERAEAMDIIIDLMIGAAGGVESLLAMQAAAWLDTALGRIGRLGARHAGRDVDPEVLLMDLESHVLAAHSTVAADMMEDSLQVLFGSALGAEQTLVVQASPGGQSHEWRDYFEALGREMPREHTLMAVQLAARALRSESVWTVLEALRPARRSGSGDANRIDLSMCIRRRWMLAVKALAWLEEALERSEPFERLMPADLMCFAIDSLLPLYPRAVVAVSHRGADAKPALASGTAWGANEVMLDATFRPVWQTNRAMVWSLFASAPVLCKIRSANYAGSEWCQRESELFEHLIGTGDFLGGRRFVEIDLDSVGVLDRVAMSNPKTHRWLGTIAGLDSAPMELRRMELWQGALIRAAAAARLVGRFMAFAERPPHAPRELANYVLEMLCSADEAAVPEEDFWGFAQGWRRLSIGLRADASALALGGPLAKVAKDEAVEDAERWFETTRKYVPRVSPGELSPCDLCAALEWREHLEPYLRKQNVGTLLENQAAIIDLRETNPDEWWTHPGWAVARGLIFLRLPYPIIVRQRAGQHAERWPLFRELDIPMFTEHIAGQRLPQSEVFFLLGGSWPGLFAKAVSEFVELESSLAAACRASLSSGDDPVFVRAGGGLSALSI